MIQNKILVVFNIGGGNGGFQIWGRGYPRPKSFRLGVWIESSSKDLVEVLFRDLRDLQGLYSVSRGPSGLDFRDLIGMQGL